MDEENRGMDVSVAIPAYNERGYLNETVRDVRRTLEQQDCSFDIIISEGGSGDGTQKVAEDLEEELPEVEYLRLEERTGKGKAVEKAFRFSERDFFVFMDADGATAADQLPEMLEELQEHDIVIGSRAEDAERDLGRKLASKMFNLGVRSLFFTGFSDHQCGFKGFRTEKVDDLIDSFESEHWFWDTELLVKARKKGLEVGVLPVEWEEKGDSEVDVFSDGVYFSRKLVELRMREWMK
ncbi:MAG: glycosyltransferase [Candidatus Nanosalina sp.]